MANQEVGVVFLVIGVVMVSLDLTSLVAVVLGRWRGDVLVEELVVFLGQIENFTVGRGESNILGRGSRNDFNDLVWKVFYFIFDQLGNLLLPLFFDNG